MRYRLVCIAAFSVAGTLAAGPRRLNTLVSELARADAIRVERAERERALWSLTFRCPTSGWVHIRAVAEEGCGPVRLLLDRAAEPVLALPRERSEAMRYVSAGEHRLSVHGTGPVALREVTVRSVPEILVYMVEHLERKRSAMWYCHDWEFLERAILPHCNAVVSHPREPYAPAARGWRAAGKRWLINQGFAKLRDPKADLAAYWRGLLGKDWVDGTIHDELLRADLARVPAWEEAFAAIAADPGLRGKRITLFGPWSVPDVESMRAFRVVDGGACGTSKSMQVGGVSKLLTFRQLKLELTPGKRYTLSAWMKAEGFKVGSLPGKGGYDGAYSGMFIINTGWYTTHASLLKPPEGTHDWRRYSRTFTARESRDGYYELIVCAPVRGRFWIDNVQLELGDRATDYVETAPDREPGRNLLVNGGFERGLDGWQQHVSQLRRLTKTVLRHGVYLAPECYINEFSSAARAERELPGRLSDKMRAWKALCPGIERQMTLILSAGSGTLRYSNDRNPAANYKVHLDRQMHLIATDPAFEGLYGVGFWSMHYVSPELVRWYGKLFRHYLIEGSTDRLSSDPYNLPHLVNGGFEQGLEGWRVEPGTGGSVKVRVRVEVLKGWSASPYMPVPERKKLLLMHRGTQASKITQAVRGLVPGRLYSLKVYTAAPGASGEPFLEAATPLSVSLSGVQMLPEHSEDRLWQVRKVKAYWTMHARVFRGKMGTDDDRLSPSFPCELTLADVPSADAPAALMVDFVQIEPFDGEK